MKQGRFAFLDSNTRSVLVDIRRKCDGSLKDVRVEPVEAVPVEVDRFKEEPLKLSGLLIGGLLISLSLSRGSIAVRLRGFKGFGAMSWDRGALAVTTFPSTSISCLAVQI